MGEFTNIAEAEMDFHLINTLLYLVVGGIAFGLMFLSSEVSGQANPLDIFIVGTSMLAGLLIGTVLVGKEKVFGSNASLSEAAGHVVMGYVFGFVGGGLGAFSFYNPEEAIYSTLLTGSPDNISIIQHTFLAPYVENLFSVGVVLALYSALKRYMAAPYALVIALAAGGTVFSAFHFGRDLSMLIAAFVFISVLVGVLIASGEGLMKSWLFPATLGGIFGIHRQNNISEFGGWLEVYDTMFSAGSPEILFSYFVAFFDIVVFGIFFAYILFRGMPFIRDILQI